MALKVIDYARRKSNGSVHAILEEFDSCNSSIGIQFKLHTQNVICVAVCIALTTSLSVLVISYPQCVVGMTLHVN